VKFQSKITTLRMGWNKIGKEGAYDLADAIKYNEHLTTLDLRGRGERILPMATPQSSFPHLLLRPPHVSALNSTQSAKIPANAWIRPNPPKSGENPQK